MTIWHLLFFLMALPSMCFSFFFFRLVYNPCKFIQFFLEIILPKNIIYTFFRRLIECEKQWKPTGKETAAKTD